MKWKGLKKKASSKGSSRNKAANPRKSLQSRIIYGGKWTQTSLWCQAITFRNIFTEWPPFERCLTRDRCRFIDNQSTSGELSILKPTVSYCPFPDDQDHLFVPMTKLHLPYSVSIWFNTATKHHVCKEKPLVVEHHVKCKFRPLKKSRTRSST